MAKTKMMRIRLDEDEYKAFSRVADLAGITLSTWVRERLRRVAINELEMVGERVPFIKPIPLGGSDE
jgi:antitoxin component of RelBE/YafQ-DinJ toxin-antitoxin module